MGEKGQISRDDPRLRHLFYLFYRKKKKSFALSISREISEEIKNFALISDNIFLARSEVESMEFAGKNVWCTRRWNSTRGAAHATQVASLLHYIGESWFKETSAENGNGLGNWRDLSSRIFFHYFQQICAIIV